MARELVATVRCDQCGATEEVEKWRIGFGNTDVELDLCSACAAKLTLVEMLGHPSGRRSMGGTARGPARVKYAIVDAE